MDSRIEEIFLALTLFLLFAKLFGELMLRLKQPALLGELLAGIIFGPYLLGKLFFETSLFSGETFNSFYEIGAAFFFFVIGYSEIDILQLKRIARDSIIASIPNVLLSFIVGFIIGVFWGYSTLASLFIGLALSLTAIGVSARTLMDLGRLHTDYGMLILGEAIIDALRSLLMLSFLILFIQPETAFSFGTALVLIGKFIAFFVGALLFYLLLLDPIARLLRQFLIDEAKFGIMMAIVLFFSFAAQKLGLHMIIGSFVAGIILALEAEFKTKDIEYKIYGFSYGFFIPLFFAILGARVNFGALVEGGLLAVVIIVAAIGVKFIGGYLGGLLIGFSSRKSWVVGSGLVPRTGVELVVVAVALDAGLIDNKMFASIVAMVAITVFVTPFLLKFYIDRYEKFSAKAEKKK
ncbi:MAG: cation:proton antiporter [Calditrichaeota bacterium]|nr:cation:proton antiporter [Calditrichota bacterium]